MLPSDFALLYYFCCFYTYSHREHSNNFYRENGFLPRIPRFTKKHCVWKFPRLGQFVFIVAATRRWRLGEWYWQGKTEGLGENSVHCCFVEHISDMGWPWIEAGPPRPACAMVRPNCYRRNPPWCFLLGAQLTIHSVTTATMLDAHRKHTFVTKFKRMWLFLWVFFKNKIFSTNLHTGNR